jgi:hypothetical protein
MGAKRDFALIKHSHELGDLLDLDLTGLADNSLLQYDAASGDWQDVTVAGLNGQLDHGTLLGLADNDHPQYALAVTDMIAGAGLTGGGTLAANRTFAVGAGTGISVSADAVAVDQTFTPTWTGIHTFTTDVSIGGDLTVTGDITISAGNLFINSTPRNIWLGDLNIQSVIPQIIFTETDGGTDAKWWDFAVNGEVLMGRIFDDAQTSTPLWLAVSRAANTVSGIALGNATDMPAVTVYGRGLFTKASDGAVANSTLALSSALPFLDFIETDQAADTQRYTMRVSGSIFRLSSFNDAGSVGRDILAATRSTTAVATISIGNATDNPVVDVLGTGHFRLTSDNAEIKIGAGQDLRLYHDGTNSIVRTDVGELRLQLGTQVKQRMTAGGLFVNSTTARGSGNNFLDFTDPTGGKGYLGYAGANDDFYVHNRLDGPIHFGVNDAEVARFDRSTTAGQTRFLIYDVDNATLERVSVGAADSGGAGFKVLRIAN